ncbi:MAG: PIG-L deacetylase family protein [Acidimicrobiales bacterium]
MRALDLAPTSALAVYAHPDDADVACGGLLARWAGEGTAVHLVVVCDGAKGSHRPTDAARLARERLGELADAAALLGAKTFESLGRSDGDVTNDVDLRAALVARVRTHRPDVVVAPDPTAVFFNGVYVNHRDHRETGWAVLDAVAPAAAMPLYFPDAGPPHQVAHLLLSGTHEPDVVADVTGSIDAKLRAILAHASQLADDADLVRRLVTERAEIAGREIGADYGEAFRSVDLAY